MPSFLWTFTIKEEVIAVATAPTTIGKPHVRVWRDGIRLSPNDIPNAFAILAGLCDPTYENTDWEAVDQLAKQAQRAMSEGVATMPSLTVALLSKAATGSYIAGRDALNREFHARGGRNFLFEHNANSRVPPFPQASIRIEPLTADHQMLKMKITPIGAPQVFRGLQHGHIEHQLANDADLPLIVGSVSITVPLQVTDQGRTYRFDTAPFADAMRKHQFVPGEHMKFSQTTGRAFATRLEQYYGRQTSGYSATIELDLTDGYSASMGTHGCVFSTYDTWEQEHTTHYTRSGTVFSGPISTKFDSTELETPEIYIAIKGSALHLPDREKFVLDMAAKLTESITSYHE